MFSEKLHCHKLLRDIGMNNLRHVLTVKFTELKVNSSNHSMQVLSVGSEFSCKWSMAELSELTTVLRLPVCQRVSGRINDTLHFAMLLKRGAQQVTWFLEFWLMTSSVLHDTIIVQLECNSRYYLIKFCWENEHELKEKWKMADIRTAHSILFLSVEGQRLC